MPSLVDSLKTVSRRVIIVGTVPVSDPESLRLLNEQIFTRLAAADLRCEVVAESDNQLFQHSLRTDTSHFQDPAGRLTFTQLKFRRRLIETALESVDVDKERTSFRISTLPLSLYLLVLDQTIWYLPITGYPARLERFKELTVGDTWFEMISTYLRDLEDPTRDGRYLARSGAELLELFDQERIPRGIYPRDCFYDSDHYQLVVWDFVFSREGQMLIHQRAENARDNQGMWDKSVGGHVDFEKERNSETAAARELIEELYTKEKKEQSGHEYSLLSGDLNKVYSLGEWRPEGRGGEVLSYLAALEKSTRTGEEPWVYYRIPGTIEHNTPRILPSGGERRLRVLADVFVFISNTILTPEYARQQLLNSRFLLVDPSVLKTWIDTGVDDRGQQFVASPDLKFIMSGRFRDTIDEVSQIIKYSQIRRR